MSFSISNTFLSINYHRTRSNDSDVCYTSEVESAFESDTDYHSKSSNVNHIAPSSQKRKIKNKNTKKSLCFWYLQKPFAHLPFIYFCFTFLSSFALIFYWFMDNDSCFILSGIISFPMCIYATFKFKKAMNLKQNLDKFNQLNIEFKTENQKMKSEIDRVKNAVLILKKTKQRLTKANKKNKENLKKFEEIEDNLQAVGKKANIKLTQINKMTKELKVRWREECLSTERDMLHAVFRRYERKHTNKSNLGMTAADFEEFQRMLPDRYAERFERMGTFHTFACDKSMIGLQDFARTLDVFAEMDTDDKDINLTLKPKPLRLWREEHQMLDPFFVADISSFDFEIDPCPPIYVD